MVPPSVPIIFRSSGWGTVACADSAAVAAALASFCASAADVAAAASAASLADSSAAFCAFASSVIAFAISASAFTLALASATASRNAAFSSSPRESIKACCAAVGGLSATRFFFAFDSTLDFVLAVIFAAVCSSAFAQSSAGEIDGSAA